MGKYGAKIWNGGEIGGGTPGRDMLTAGKEFEPNVRWGERRGGNPGWAYLPKGRIMCPLYVRGGPDGNGMTGVGGSL